MRESLRTLNRYGPRAGEISIKFRVLMGMKRSQANCEPFVNVAERNEDMEQAKKIYKFLVKRVSQNKAFNLKVPK